MNKAQFWKKLLFDVSGGSMSFCDNPSNLSMKNLSLLVGVVKDLKIIWKIRQFCDTLLLD